MTADDARKLTEEAKVAHVEYAETLLKRWYDAIRRAARAGKTSVRSTEISPLRMIVPVEAHRAAHDKLKADGFTVKTVADGPNESAVEVSWQGVTMSEEQFTRDDGTPLSRADIERACCQCLLDKWREEKGYGQPGGCRVFARAVCLAPDGVWWHDWRLFGAVQSGYEIIAVRSEDSPLLRKEISERMMQGQSEGWFQVRDLWVNWCRHNSPDGPHTPRVSDWANPKGDGA
jgi:hypothetical protein